MYMSGGAWLGAIRPTTAPPSNQMQHTTSEVRSRQSRLETVMTRLRHARPLDKAEAKLAPLPLRLRRAGQVAQDRRHKQWTSLEAQLRVLSHRRTLERGSCGWVAQSLCCTLP